jgi:hypothetical protein
MGSEEVVLHSFLDLITSIFIKCYIMLVPHFYIITCPILQIVYTELGRSWRVLEVLGVACAKLACAGGT